LVAVTMQVPELVELSCPLEMLQPEAVPPLSMTKETAPVPEPPLVVSVSGVPNVPLVEVMESGAWLSLAAVTVNPVLADPVELVRSTSPA
jgi:hypothetical protein